MVQRCRRPLVWLMAALLVAAPFHANASKALGHAPPNFGSNWSHVCDNTQASECRSAVAGHSYRYFDLTANMVVATDEAITTDVNPTDLFMFAVTSGEDTGYFDANYGTAGFAAGWTQCQSPAGSPGMEYGGSEALHTLV